jgi:hypothetical protein
MYFYNPTTISIVVSLLRLSTAIPTELVPANDHLLLSNEMKTGSAAWQSCNPGQLYCRDEILAMGAAVLSFAPIFLSPPDLPSFP